MIERKVLDEKCLTILENLDAFKTPASNETLYRVSGPTKYPTHMKRLREMAGAGLIRKYSGFYHEITDFGRQVLEDLKA